MTFTFLLKLLDQSCIWGISLRRKNQITKIWRETSWNIRCLRDNIQTVFNEVLTQDRIYRCLWYSSVVWNFRVLVTGYLLN
jgi:hypothetical protein